MYLRNVLVCRHHSPILYAVVKSLLSSNPLKQSFEQASILYAYYKMLHKRSYIENFVVSPGNWGRDGAVREVLTYLAADVCLALEMCILPEHCLPIVMCNLNLKDCT